jgi:hypothetical protein
MIPSYLKLYHIGAPEVSELLRGVVEVTEKVDGSQFSFAFIKGELYCKSKNKLQDVYAPDKLFLAAVNTCRDIQDRLQPEWVYYGETLASPRHNTLKYDRVPINHIALFAIKDDMGNFLSHARMVKEARSLGLDVVPLLYEGVVGAPDLEELVKNTDSFLGGTKIEGIVVRTLAGWTKQYDKEFPFQSGKYVSESFKELNHKAWTGASNKGQYATLLDSLASEARWDKAVQHLRDEGLLTHSPRDIGELVKKVQQDFEEEDKETIKEALWNIYSRDMRRYLSKGLPEWYKLKLLHGEIT